MTTQDLTQLEIQEIARILGVPPAEIRASRPEWNKLLKEGVTVAVHIGRYRGFTALSFDDLGIYQDEQSREAFAQLVELGKIRTLPKGYLDQWQNIESKMRQAPKRIGFPTHWGDFLTYEAFAEFREVEEKLRAEFFQLRDDLCDEKEWNLVVDEMMQEWATMAAQAYRIANKLTPDAKSIAELLKYENDLAKMDAFVDAYVQRMLAELPTREAVKASFTWAMEYRYIPLPDILAQELANAQIAESEVEISRERVYQEKMVTDFKQRQAAAELDATLDQLSMKEKMLREMNKEVVSQARNQADELLKGFFSDIIEKSRSFVYSTYEGLMSRLETKGELHHNQINQLQSLIARIEQIAGFYGDKEIEALLSPARAILQDMPEVRTGRANDYVEMMKRAQGEAQRTLLAIGRGRTSRPTEVIEAIGDVRTGRRTARTEEISFPDETTPRKSRRTTKSI